MSQVFWRLSSALFLGRRGFRMGPPLLRCGVAIVACRLDWRAGWRGGGLVLAICGRTPGVVHLASRRRVIPICVWGRVDVVRDEEPEVLLGPL